MSAHAYAEPKGDYQNTRGQIYDPQAEFGCKEIQEQPEEWDSGEILGEILMTYTKQQTPSMEAAKDDAMSLAEAPNSRARRVYPAVASRFIAASRAEANILLPC